MSGPTDSPTPPAGAASPLVVPVDLRDYADLSPEGARRVRVLAGDHVATDLWCLEPGQRTPVLRLPDQDVAYTVVGGRSWFVTDEGEVGLDPMGALLVRAGVVHGIDNRGADPLIVVATVGPPGVEQPAAPVADDAEAVHRPHERRNPLVRAWRSLLGVDRG